MPGEWVSETALICKANAMHHITKTMEKFYALSFFCYYYYYCGFFPGHEWCFCSAFHIFLDFYLAVHRISTLLSHPFIRSLSPLHYLWLFRSGCQAVFSECPYIDYSPRNHVAQLNYHCLQRPLLLLRHLKNAPFNQPIAAKPSTIPAHKGTLLCCPRWPWGTTAN